MSTSPGEPAGVAPGDPVPKLVLPDGKGGRVDFTHQSIAGQTVVIWAVRGTPEPAARQALAAQLRAFEAIEARVFAVASGAGAPPSAAETEDSPLPQLFDADGRMARTFGIIGSGVIVIDIDGRLVQVLQGDAFDEALAVCKRLHGRSAPEVLGAQAPVLLIANVLEPELCQRVIDYWNAGEKLAGNVATSGRGNEQAYAAMKKRDDVIIADIDIFNILKARIARRVVPEVLKAFQFRIFSLEAIRIGCYDSADGGYFRRHRDNRTPYTAHRQFALSLNLNTGDYAGGELRYPEYGRQLYAPGIGGAVIFSCSLLHEALPVTSGRRFALFSFLCDEAGAAKERKLIANEQAAGREGVSMRTSGRTSGSSVPSA